MPQLHKLALFCKLDSNESIPAVDSTTNLNTKQACDLHPVKFSMSVILKTDKLHVEFNSRELRQKTKTALVQLDLEVTPVKSSVPRPERCRQDHHHECPARFIPPTAARHISSGLMSATSPPAHRLSAELTVLLQILTADELLRLSTPKIFGLSRADTDQRIPDCSNWSNSNTLRSVDQILFQGMQQRVGWRRRSSTIPICSSSTNRQRPGSLGRMKVR